ncbi:uncharacterized protein V2V93DRAFT_362467 [Kockiozyma suomiensis]|uniref:uncharacterized protein n=1 Tax=Kockiozyma suomiensis TaxID=1337062 RepID=UPI003343AF69
MASLNLTVTRLVLLMLQLAIVSHVALLSQNAVFGNSFSDIYRPIIMPFLFAISMALFLRQRQRQRQRLISSRSIHIATVVYSTATPLLCRLVGEYTGLYLGPWLGPLFMDFVCLYPVVIGAGSIAARIFQTSTSKAAKSAIGGAGASDLRLFLVALFTTRLYMICGTRIVGRLYAPMVLSFFPQWWTALRQTAITNMAASLMVALLNPPRRIILPLVLASIACQLAYIDSRMVGSMKQSAIENGGLVASTMSSLGYLSVISRPEQGILALRNDHSLLGGEFIKPPPSIAEEIPKGMVWNREPIYSAFVMQEAVRLVTPAPSGIYQQGEKINNALVIGLGIGTSAKAMISHNISTDVVELDSNVLQYAVQFFDFPINQSRVTICDGRHFIHSLAHTLRHEPLVAEKEALRHYDYIIHDVFAGGAVAPELFTSETWDDVRQIMAPDGVLVVNVGGYFEMSLTRILIRTLVNNFRSNGGRCRAFRDEPRSREWVEGESDFTNIVVFCRRAEGAAIRFRPAQTEDFLNSIVRRKAMVLKNEIELPVYLRDSEEALELRGEAGVRTISDDTTNKVVLQAAESAAQHWRLMNEVIDWRTWARW